MSRRFRAMDASRALRLAHDLNNMLTAIRGNAELLRNDAGAAGPADQLVLAADRAEQLSRELVDEIRRA